MSDFQFGDNLNVVRETSVLFRDATHSCNSGNGDRRMIMVGMHLTRTRGGITTLATAILNSSLATEYDITYIAAQAEDFGPIRKFLLAALSGLRFFVSCVFSRPSVVYVHVGSNASLYREQLFVLLAKLLKKPVILHFHAGDLEQYLRRQPVIGQRFIRFVMGLSDRIIAVSEESARQVYGLTLNRSISVLPNTIDCQALCAMKRREKSPSDVARLLFVGAVGKLKGESDLIKALSKLQAKGIEFKLDIVGFGAEKMTSHLKEAGISQFIGHLGPASLAERLPLFERADIFVLPTYAEAMPVSVIEAMAAGLAIVTTPVGGIPELIDDGAEGLLIQPGDINALAEMIEHLILDQKARFSLGDNARRRVEEQLNMTSYIQQLRLEIAAIQRI